MAAGKAQGLYFGLPTMATANAMFERMANTAGAVSAGLPSQPDSGA